MLNIPFVNQPCKVCYMSLVYSNEYTGPKEQLLAHSIHKLPLLALKAPLLVKSF